MTEMARLQLAADACPGQGRRTREYDVRMYIKGKREGHFAVHKQGADHARTVASVLCHQACKAAVLDCVRTSVARVVQLRIKAPHLPDRFRN